MNKLQQRKSDLLSLNPRKFWDTVDDVMNSLFDRAGITRTLTSWQMDTEDSAKLVVPLPGYAPADVDVAIKGNILSISSLKKDEQFDYEVTLPFEVNTKKTEGELKNGLLTLTVYRDETTKPVKISVK